MKVKTEARRQAILDVAAEAFREHGFERTSMNEICARVGGSKATLYNYFASKEELFFEVMMAASERDFEATHQFIDPAEKGLAYALRYFGERFIAFIYSPQVLANRVLAIAEAGRTNLGRLTYERAVLRSRRLIAEYLAAAMRAGLLRKADANIATVHLMSLLESELLEASLLRVVDKVEPKQIKDGVARAVDVFMAAYGSTDDKPKGTRVSARK
ncbi:MAG: TetR/AcrR family transcriptional regulator [Rhodocyclaceae bacterium]